MGWSILGATVPRGVFYQGRKVFKCWQIRLAATGEEAKRTCSGCMLFEG